jgi:hypothetical protein
MPFNFLTSANQKAKSPDFITIVSGLPRSGTSMMMQVLQAGGMQILTDRIRQADLDNPKGYYEFERVKKMKDGDTKWVKNARGKAVKVISALLEHLPADYDYKVIFMHRKMGEILASQEQMLNRRGEPSGKVSDEKMSELFTKHLATVQDWLSQQDNMDVLFIQYDEFMAQPGPHIEALVNFLGLPLDAKAMSQVPDQNLHRQRN